jgi:hypothetical protein
MKRKILIASALTLALVAIGGSAVALAAGFRQETPPMTGNGAAMHAACVSGSAEAMHAAIDNMTEADWQAMAGQMSAHTSGMMESGNHADMMGGGAQDGVGGMMGSGSAGGMMGGTGGMMGGGAGMMSF